MSLFPLSPVAQRLAVGAIVLATAGAGLSLLNSKNTSESTVAPALPAIKALADATPAIPTSAPATSALAASAALPASGALASNTANTANTAHAALEVVALTLGQSGNSGNSGKAAPKTSTTRRFPFVTSLNSAHAAAAARINQQLFIDTFEVLAPLRASDGLNEVSAPIWQTRPEINFKVQRNDARIFSVTLTSEGCGAYCETSDLSHAFDVSTGRHLSVEDILTAAGKIALGKELKAANLAAIQAEINRLKNEVAKATGKGAGADKKHVASEEQTTALRMYEECTQQRQAPDYVWSLEARTMQIQAQGVAFSTERCSNHALQALDRLGAFSLRLTSDKLAPWLNSYGRYLLLGEVADAVAVNAEPATAWEQVLHGSLGGKLAVTVYIGSLNADGSVNGRYFYDKHRKPISLFGRFESGTLTLTETESQDKPQPRWVLTPQGKEWRGRWEGSSSLEISLAP